MCDLLPTQDVGDCAGLEEIQSGEKPWGRLLPLREAIPALSMLKDLYTIGREESCDFKFTQDMFDQKGHLSAISKLHFRITRESTAQGLLAFIYDLSSNGTFLNEQKIGKGKKQPLNNNDEISVAIKNCKCFIFSDLMSVQREFPFVVTSKYTISRSLGRGACGEVRLVFGRETCQKFAMKIVQKKTFSFLARGGENVIDRVQSEVAILMKMNHPCIVRIFDVINTEETLYMILELVEYGELFDRVVKLGQLSENDSKLIFLQIVLATKYLHDNGITHRDLKPENILLSGPSNQCLIKVTDFGLSKFVDGNTMLRTFCGTPTYLAPEVLLTAGSGVYTSSIDVWSLGVILYICLVGYPPFTDEREDFELQQQILGGHFDFPELYWKGIGESVKDLIRKLLTVDPKERISLEEALNHPWLADPVTRKYLADLLFSSDFEVPPELKCECSDAYLSALPTLKFNGIEVITNKIIVDENSKDNTNDAAPSSSSESIPNNITASDEHLMDSTSTLLHNPPVVRKRAPSYNDCPVAEKKGHLH